MAHTIIGLFNNEAAAKNAMHALIANGIQQDYIRTTPEDIDDERHDEHSSEGVAGFFRSLFGKDEHLVSAYSDAVHKGHTMVTVEIENDVQNQRAIDVLNQFDPIDIEEDTAATSRSATGGVERSKKADSGTHIPVIQEELAVGKRTVQRGGVRIVQHVHSKPVEESVRLREEHVKVERHPVNQQISIEEAEALKDQTMEFQESSEEAVVSKKARVVEEVVISKDVEEHTATIKDTVRSTDVEIEKLDKTVGKPPKKSR